MAGQTTLLTVTMKKMPLVLGISFIGIFAGLPAVAQETNTDSLLAGLDKKVLDSLDEELNALLKYFNKPVSFLSVNATAANGFYDFKTNNNNHLESGSRLVLSPSVAYYHKSGFGLSASGFALQNNNALHFYQWALSPSFAYLSNRHFSIGIAYTHYFTKDSLAFYTSPLNNEWYGWFTLKKGWLEPTLAFGYGWGSWQQYQKRYYMILAQWLLRRRNIIARNSHIAVRDHALSVSVKHNFIWTHVLSKKGSLLLSPMLMLSGGTQSFGFNTTYSYNSHVINNFLLGNTTTASKSGWALRSLSGMLYGDYSIGKFFIQPQIVMDYYLPETEENHLRCVVAVTAGVNF
jgi:hypothetical protein